MNENQFGLKYPNIDMEYHSLFTEALYILFPPVD